MKTSQSKVLLEISVTGGNRVERWQFTVVVKELYYPIVNSGCITYQLCVPL